MGGITGVIMRLVDEFIGPVLIYFYPLYVSLETLKRPSLHDCRQWVIYWILLSLVTTFELLCWKTLGWFPIPFIWSYMKLLMFTWLALPIFNGASFSYEKFISIYYNNYVCKHLNNIFGI